MAGRQIRRDLPAKQGDPELLRDFIARAHPDDVCELAGLNYWAYWVGDVDQWQRDDIFMIDQTLRWRGTRLLRHLVDRLRPETLLDCDGLSTQSRRELTSILYGLRMDGLSPKGAA